MLKIFHGAVSALNLNVNVLMNHTCLSKVCFNAHTCICTITEGDRQN